MKAFDLNEAISEWSKALKNHPGFEPGYVEELEANLWDRVDDLIANGFTEKQAFDEACERMISSENELAREYFWVNAVKENAKPVWERPPGLMSKLPSHLKSAFRHLKRRKAYTLMNVLGLSVSISFSFLIWIYINHQRSFDAQFENAERIYRVIFDVKRNSLDLPQADIGQPVGPTLKADFPNVIEKTRLRRIGATNTLTNEDVSIESSDFFVTDEDYFKVFSTELIYGNKATALTEPNTVVLSESLALSLFGRTDVVGDVLMYSGVRPPMLVKVSGVMKDLGDKTHLRMKALISYSTYFDQRELVNWLRKSYTYVLLDERNEIESLEAQMPEFTDKYLLEVLRRRVAQDVSVDITFQPLTEIHLADEYLGEPYPHGNRANLRILEIIMIFLLFMAGINYVNLTTATAIERVNEVGIRKTLGSTRLDLASKFLSESIFLAILSGFVALLFSCIALPYFNAIAGLSFDRIDLFESRFLLLLLSSSLTIGLLAGIYPSIFMTRFNGLSNLKGFDPRSFKGNWLRKGLIVFQYSIAGSLMIWILVVSEQIEFMKTRDVGFQKENIIEINLPDDESALVTASAFISEVKELPEINGLIKTTADFASDYGPGTHLMLSPTGEKMSVPLSAMSASYGLVDALGIDFVTGRGFNKNDPNERGILINETAVLQNGWQENPLNVKYLSRNREGDVVEEWQCVGVISDFKKGESYNSVHPMIVFLDDRTIPEMSLLINANNMEMGAAIARIEGLWNKYFPDYAFQYEMLEDRLNGLYSREETFYELLSTINFITVLITMLGVVGLITFTAQIKRKEIAIRKVNGARIESILVLLLRQFGFLLFLAFIIAGPIGFMLSSNWLNSFSIHINVSAAPVFISFGFSLALTITVILYQAMKAANANPVLSLRDE